jgi:hypothetical protein
MRAMSRPAHSFFINCRNSVIGSVKGSELLTVKCFSILLWFILTWVQNVLLSTSMFLQSKDMSEVNLAAWKCNIDCFNSRFRNWDHADQWFSPGFQVLQKVDQEK